MEEKYKIDFVMTGETFVIAKTGKEAVQRFKNTKFVGIKTISTSAASTRIFSDKG